MRPIQPPPPADSIRPRRCWPDLTLPTTTPITQQVWSPAEPCISPLAAASSSSLNFSEMEQISRIISGGTGTVYRVLHRPSGKLYASRVVNDTHDYVIRRQIQQEIDILCELDNPNVVKCHGVFDNDGEIQVVFEYMDGGSLKGVHIADERSLADVTRQILLGLHFLHSRKIVHRHIKPSNLLINSQNQVKIAHFGISKSLAETIELSTCMIDLSTIAYISPERINTDMCGRVCDTYKGDIWSVGVTVLELYLGRSPFAVAVAEQSISAIFMSVVFAQPPPETPQTASTAFRDFIACCLQRDLRKRWTAEQLLRHPFIAQNHNQAH
ncbi:mitogen-activated protein kinase kinase 5-like [Cornus florida]|uniref:mitogen-activated protein kinase kinase 5-like n=1 Tax=Cornus florida TaxID=4283 RepID=UPI00289BE86D|nr:mitogen-activated protein kinase kinase 5-like [Cornus florida]